MSSAITQPTSFSTSKLSLTPLKASARIRGYSSAYLNYSGGMALVFQTPSLPTSFGYTMREENGRKKYSFDISLREYDSNPKVKSFYEALNALDEWMIDQGVKNSKAWFGKEKSREVVEENYTRMVKWSVDKETGERKPYPPNLKIKLQATDDGEFSAKFYNNKSEQIKDTPLEEILVKRAELTSLIQNTGLYVVNGKFGLGWKAVQVRVDKMPQSLKNLTFENEDGEDDTRQAVAGDAPAFHEPAEFGGAAAGGGGVEGNSEEEFGSKPKAPPKIDDDDEEEVAKPPPKKVESTQDDDEEEVAAPPVPKKKTIVTKKIVTKKA